MASSADKDSNKSDNDYDPFKIRSVRETFGEKEEVIDIINSLEEIGSNLIKSERATERFTCTLLNDDAYFPVARLSHDTVLLFSHRYYR